MRYDDKRKVCQRTAIWIDVLGIEFGFIPEESANKALNVFIVLLALALAGNFYFKNKQDR